MSTPFPPNGGHPYPPWRYGTVSTAMISQDNAQDAPHIVIRGGQRGGGPLHSESAPTDGHDRTSTHKRQYWEGGKGENS